MMKCMSLLPTDNNRASEDGISEFQEVNCHQEKIDQVKPETSKCLLLETHGEEVSIINIS